MHKHHPDIGPKPGKPFRVQHVQQYFTAGRPLTMLTAYDAITARIIDSAEIDMILVGDSYGTTMLGMSSTVG
ncbi:3-methyl-2-oxobutanoate hydroxymethyltransferase [Mobiluncus curtisii]|nr:3-methyl-2-oxobutanoate hydroxymethyltransferase [Mobiluncus curtisii]